MVRLLRIAVLVLILALLTPVLFDRLSILDEYGKYGEDGKYEVSGSDPVKPRSAYRAEVDQGEKAISRLEKDHRILASGHVSENVRLIAASDYQGEAVVVAGKRSQLYIFRKKKGRYLLKQVLWDGTTNFPLSLAITENGRYAIMRTGETMAIDERLANLPPKFRLGKGMKLYLVIWDIEKEEKVQEIDTHLVQYGSGSPMPLATAGRNLVWNGISFINADLSGKKDQSDAYIRPDFVAKGQSIRVAYAPLIRQILVRNGAENNLTLYKVRDDARDKWWKWWSNDITFEKTRDTFQACSLGRDKCYLDARSLAFEVAPDGKFFVIWRRDGMLEAYSLPDGTFMSSIQTPNDMRVVREPHLTIMDGVVYLANGIKSSDDDSAFWSWKPGDAQARSHGLECADYTRLLNNGYIVTLGCGNEDMELGLVALTDHSRIQTFSQPLRLQ